jgi:hypothetical protein
MTPTPPTALIPALPECVAYWTRGEPRANFGDYLTELLYAGLFYGPPKHPDARIHLIGSVIAPHQIKEDIALGYRQVVFWGCGVRRYVPLPPAIRRRAVFLGVRGPLSRDALGLPKRSTPLGDPALLLPRLVKPASGARTSGKTICVPHYYDDTNRTTLRKTSGANFILSSKIASNEGACRQLISAIASASFVLAGSLHAAIVAYAYGVPFAFFAARKISLPFKWLDFSASIGFECEFVATVAEGMRFHERNRGRASLCSPEGLLAVAPFPLKPAFR